jgi:transposase
MEPMTSALELEPLDDDLEALQSALRHSQAALSKRDAVIAHQETLIAKLQAEVNLLVARRFGASSERVSDAQLGLFNEAEALAEAGADELDEATTEVASHARQRPKRKGLPEILTRVEVEHELAESERRCAVHDVALERFGEEVSEQLDIIPATVQVLRHKRGKYRCPCCTGHLVTAPLPAQPIPKSMASPGLLAHIVVAKYVDALPLYRQQQQFGRIGVALSRTTLASWMVKLGALVQPLINLLRETLLSRGYVLMDETTVQVLDEAGKAAESKSYLWAQMSVGDAPIILFDYDATRSSAIPLSLLEGFSVQRHPAVIARGVLGHVAHRRLSRL